MKDYDKNKEPLYLKYCDVNNLHGWEMSQKFSVDGFKWVKNISQFKKDFIKNYNEDNDEGYFLEVDILYYKKLHGVHNGIFLKLIFIFLKNYMVYTKIYCFYLKEWKLKKL